MEPARRSVEILIRNELSQMTTVSHALERIGHEFEIPAETYVKLQIALDEIVSNIIKYAWPNGEMHEFLVRIDVGQDRVEIHTIDDGMAFDPRDAPLREAPAPGFRPRPGGLGVQIVKQLVDQIDYIRADGRNHTILTKRLDVEASRLGGADAS
jgi:anti-sigma regulatory factor (Ser/Thr protein kinase)